MMSRIKWLLLIYFKFCVAWMDERPVLESRDGNLFISSAKDRNITLKTLGDGNVNINDVNLLRVALEAQKSSQLIEKWKSGRLADVELSIQRLSEYVEGPHGILRRFDTLIGSGFPSTSNTNSNVTSLYGVTDVDYRKMRAKIRSLIRRVRNMERKLRKNECVSDPCQNGGTCIDLYDGVQCLCPRQFEGPYCSIDVNECTTYKNTDLGCQNEATCHNLYGSYECHCAPGWYGKDCILKSTNCSMQNDAELCGQGHCISAAGSPLGYTCLCKQGWEAQDATNPACTKDVNECAQNHPPCSINPPVVCHNIPGSYFCGSCPQGYTGNGYYCIDLDECLVDNGGCSTVPRVQCINTMGSRICGSCPSGYEGDGVTCVFVGGCKINNGGCHPLAVCIDGPYGRVQCLCHSGYIGDGIVTCLPGTNTSVVPGACGSNPCIHGTCVSHDANKFSCNCQPGFIGKTCSIPVNPCNPNPCKNNGICKTASSGDLMCECTSSFTGSRCERARQACGAVLRDPVGIVEYPLGGLNYQDGQTCAWQLKTNHSSVFNVTFTRFNLETSSECSYDFLEIHDGESTRDHPLGRFCGNINNLPNNGNIISSRNALYFWFRSDHSVASEGFTFNWTIIPPVCGGTIRADIGTINSPGYPGKYPPHRDCYWYIYVSPGKRINLHFAQLMLEEHETCSNDYLEINETTNHENKRLGLYCNHTHPSPVLSSGSEVVLHFHSDSAGQDFGFQITFSSEAVSPDCGGVFTSDHGDIVSPGYLSSTGYEPNMVCEWEIRLPPKERIKIIWMNFELEMSSGCIFDSVSLYHGSTTESPLIARYCGYDLPESKTLHTNILLIRLETDASSHRQGFYLKYETACGGEFYEPSGIIQSPFYPNPYPPSKTCIYKIIQPVGKSIAFTLQFMDIESLGENICEYDRLDIHDGVNENATLLASLCGSNENIPAEPFFSTYNYMYIVFFTDPNVQNHGFQANYTTLDVECGGIHTEPEGVVQYPVEEEKYKNNLNCTWLIHAPAGHIVQMSWSLFSLEHDFKCRNDYVEIFDGYDVTPSKSMGKFCSNVIPPSLMSQGQDLTVVFRSDYNLGYRGFNALYSFVDISKSCGGHLFAMTGMIRSPNYPEEYPKSMTCEWVIEAPNKHQVILRVNDFQLEEKGCFYDFLEIRNGATSNAPLIGKYCGNAQNIPSVITSFSNQMYLKFVSDTTESEKGFEIEWDLLTIGCGGSLTAATGDIISPNYPQPYGKSSLCTWNIVVAAGSVVQIVFVDFELEAHSTCRFDYLEIAEGNDANRQNINRYCGSTHPSIITFKSNKVTVRFRTDPSNHFRGFHIKYTTECHNVIRGIEGVIESPNFPRNYEHETNCSWLIDAPIGNKVNISFSHFELESGVNKDVCDNDYLEIEEGSLGLPTNKLGKFCDTDVLPPKIYSNEHQVFVTFVTDKYIAHKGFRLEWVVHGCVYHLTKPEDTFSSVGYPNGYPADIACEWLIEVDYVHSVQLTFEHVDTVKMSNCQFDKIDVYNGVNDKAPKLGEVCHSDKPVVYTSSGNKIFVTFTSDSRGTGQGFTAKYESVDLRCGGEFRAQSGIIHSPNYPLNYPHNQNCEWHITVDQDHVVNLTFTNFDIENTKNCTDDYVKVFDGTTKDSPLLGTFCHNKIPPSLISTGNQLLVVMRSDSYLTSKGFQAEYKRACGARINVTDQGILSTSSNLVLREEATNCSWILVSNDPADHITLTFTHMDFLKIYSDCNGHYVEVLDGDGVDGPSLGTWCTNDVPPPITSRGNALTVHLVDTGRNWDNSFVAYYSSLNTACGGNYTSVGGSLTTPNYPDSYPMNAECVWEIQVSPGNRVILSFSEFDLESSDNCNEDYLEVRENNGIGKLLGLFCSQTPETISANSTLWIKFKSNGVGTASGFKANYLLVHGNDLDGPVGVIASPLYPLICKLAEDFSWRITVDFGWMVKIEFEDFSIGGTTRDCADEITVYDGFDGEAPILFTECGTILPDPIISTGNIVYIKLVMSPYSVGSWFYLRWLQIPRSSVDEENTVKKLSQCNKLVSLTDPANETFSINSPGYPNGYARDLECNWIFTSPPGTHLVFQIQVMDLEESSYCLADYVAVYSGNALDAETGTLLKQECLSNSTSMKIIGTNVMTVKFVSDFSQNGTGFKGVVYRDCGGQLEGPNGFIELNNSTKIYEVQAHVCEWNVTVRPGRTIEVKFHDLNIKNKDPKICNRNFLMLKNGESASSPLLGHGKYCGDELPDTLHTSGNRLYVKASWIAQSMRFKISYREIGMDCGGKYILTSGEESEEFSTPNYPNVPPPYSECIWTFMAPAGKRLSIHFVEAFDLTDSAQCEKEYVEIRDGGTESSKLLGRYCSDIAPSTITSTDNSLYVHFYSDVSDQKNGFKAIVTTDAVCGGIIRGSKGIIRSPNYPNNYPKNQHCAWWIIGPTTYSLKIQFQDLHLPSLRACEETDHLIISEKLPDNNTATEIGTYCGWNKPDVIKTSANEAVVSFFTDDKEFTWYRGFSLNYSIVFEKCGGVLTGMSGEFQTIGYPNRNLRRYCFWKITVPDGFQVVVDILDFESDEKYPIKFYNDKYHSSKIKFLKSGDPLTQIESSSNIMVVSHFSQSGYRGFKAKYTAIAPAPCGGLVREIRGSLSVPKYRPFNESAYYCQWKMQPPDELLFSMNNTGITMSLKISGIIGESRQPSRNCLFNNKQYVRVTDSDSLVATVCGNLTSQPLYIRSPFTLNMVQVLNSSEGSPMIVNLSYEWQRCGGILRGPFHTIQAPKNLSYPISCAWEVKFPNVGEVLNLKVNRLNLGSCEKNYIIVRNGGSYSPELDKICGNIIPQKITSSSSKLWIEYHAEESPSDFEFTLDQIGNECYQSSKNEISSPKFPLSYPPNSECSWILVAEPGYHIRLEFVERFNLEFSKNCQNDYIQVSQWNEDDKGDKEWIELGKVCGRNTPVPYNSTSSRLKVLFHSNEAIEGDGFRAIWRQDCGGIFEVTRTAKYLKSPNYPSSYGRNQFCNYTLVAPEKNIIVDFIDFHVEQGTKGKHDCRWDNVTIIKRSMYNFFNEETIDVFCGSDLPSLQKSYSKMEIILRTDAYGQLPGFQLKYFMNECGGEITKPQIISSLNRGSVYFGGINCTWVIKAPPNKRVVLRFEKFSLEYSQWCGLDVVDVYEGPLIDYTKKKGTYCGNLTQTLPVIKSDNNSMTVNFVSDESNHFEGFKALVLFTNSQADGCGGVLNLTNSISFRTQNAEFYSSMQDCHWTVITLPDKQIKFIINSMDLRNSTSNSTDTRKACTGDFLEIRDGKSQYSELLAIYCGNSVPPPVKSSSNALWIRLFTDGATEGKGVTGNIEATESICGSSTYLFNMKPQTLISPLYPNPYPLDVTCRWVINGNESLGIHHIHLIDFELKDSYRCEEDFLQITDISDRHLISEGYGENLIVSGPAQNPYPLSMQSFLPMDSYKYCGSQKPHDFFSYSQKVEIKFKSTAQNAHKYKGFKLEFGVSSCDKNRTGVQGRLVHQSFTNCWVTITAPQNHTIALYFNLFIISSNPDCKNSGLQIFDGGFTDHRLGVFCGYRLPNPIFSSGNKLSLHSYQSAPEGSSVYDITYVATDKGRGCGGKFFNYAGRFTSPMYPGPYRNASDCTWEISVPVGFRVGLKFLDFDIGPEELCATDYLKVEDKRSTTFYCGKDTPANFYSSTNQVLVTYKSSVNNGGRGWLINFISLQGTRTIADD